MGPSAGADPLIELGDSYTIAEVSSRQSLYNADPRDHRDPFKLICSYNIIFDSAGKPVFIYKLITKGAVETKIMALPMRKQALVKGILTEQAEGVVTINSDNLERLLRDNTACFCLHIGRRRM